MMLSPFDCAGETPTGWLARTVAGVQVTVVLFRKPTQVLRTKIFSMPLPVFKLRFEAFEANATSSPSVAEAVVVLLPWVTLGFSLIAFPAVTPSGVEIRVADGLQAGVVVMFR